MARTSRQSIRGTVVLMAIVAFQTLTYMLVANWKLSPILILALVVNFLAIMWLGNIAYSEAEQRDNV